uniref:DNA 5'-3' helicase n=1 Tax=viral metagenome TaxID=1070528 RepID=A0A6M3M837_9ZZZZ
MIEPRLPPFSESAEEAVLGSILLDGDALNQISALTPEDFYRDQNREVYAACLELFRRNEGINQVTVAHALGDKLDSVGGAAYLMHLLSAVPTPLHAKHYAEIVAKTSVSRAVVAAGEEIARLGYDDSENALERAQGLLQRLQTGRKEGMFTTLRDVGLAALPEWSAFLDDPQHIRGLTTGFKKLDLMFDGFRPSRFYLLGARPSMGKSQVALYMAESAAKANARVAVASLEMSSQMLMERMAFTGAGVDRFLARVKGLEPTTIDLLHEQYDRVSKLSIVIDDTPASTTTQLLTKCRRLYHEKGLDLLIFDYLDLAGDKAEGEEQRRAVISQGLRRVARELNIPVLALVQLNREVEKRESKRPQLQDLRYSGALEQDCDVAMFLYREDYYVERQMMSVDESKRQKNVLEILVLKNKEGPIGKLKVFYNPNTGRIGPLADKED